MIYLTHIEFSYTIIELYLLSYMNNSLLKILSLFILFSIFTLAQVNVSIPDTTHEKVKSIEMPIIVSDLTGLGVRSYQFRLKYNQDILKVKSVIDDETLSDKRYWGVDAWLDDGDLVVRASGWFSLSGAGTLLIIKFNIIADEGKSDLTFEDFSFNYGSPSVNIKNGSFAIYAEKIISFKKSGNGEGKLQIDNEIYDLPIDKTMVLYKTYKLSAIPSTGNNFDNWSGALQTSKNPVDFTIESNAEITANFSVKVHSVSAVVQPDSYGNVEGQGVYNYGDMVTLKANPYSGKEFVSWTRNGEVISNDSEYSFTVNNDIKLEANFANLLFLVSTVSNPIGGGSINGAGYYYFNETANLHAQCNEGWEFLNWMENDEIISQDSTINLNVNGDRQIIANFTLITGLNNENIISDKNYLYNPYPNPFNPTTTFKFQIAKPSEVSLTIFDLTGQIVAQPIESSNFGVGIYYKNLEASFGKNEMSSSIYFYRFNAVDNLGEISVKTGKLILLK